MIRKYSTYLSTFIWGAASLLVLGFVEVSDSLLDFVIIKGLALASCYWCYKTIKKADADGKMPDFWYKEYNDEFTD